MTAFYSTTEDDCNSLLKSIVAFGEMIPACKTVATTKPVADLQEIWSH